MLVGERNWVKDSSIRDADEKNGESFGENLSVT